MRYFWLVCQQIGGFGRPLQQHEEEHITGFGHPGAGGSCYRSLHGSRSVRQGSKQVVDRLDPQTFTGLQDSDNLGLNSVGQLAKTHATKHHQFHRWLRQQSRFSGLPCLPNLVSGTEVEFVRVDGQVVVIGRGQYGVVCLARSVHTQKLLAVKILFKQNSTNTDVVLEGALLQAVRLTVSTPDFHGIGFLQLKNNTRFCHYCLVTEFVADPTLHVTSLGTYVTALRSRSYFCAQLAKTDSAVYLTELLTLIGDIVEGLSKIHKQSVVINDIKLDNILLHRKTDTWKPLFIDFGMAKLGDYKMDYCIPDTQQGKLEFLRTYQQVAPEVVSSGYCSPVSDVYSLGWLLLFLGQQFQMLDIVKLGHRCLLPEARRPTTVQILREIWEIQKSVGSVQFLAWLVMLKERLSLSTDNQRSVI